MLKFSEMTPVQIAAQIVGLVGLVFIMLSYQQKERKRILYLQMVSCAVFAAGFLMLGAYTGCVMNAVGLVRAVVFSIDRKWAKSPVWVGVFIAVFTVAGVLTWEKWYSVFPIVAQILGSISLRLKNPTAIRLVSLPTSPSWLVYNVFANSYSGVLTEALVTASIVSAIIRLDIIGRRRIGNA
ncbi:MAG: YgjV family protein [Clostridia bacterium]|nr:YgjV family protein [Clostridia bacterium]